MGYGFYDITLYGFGNKDFAYRNNLVSSLYIDFLDGYKPKGTTRMSVDIGDEDRINSYFGSILSAEVAFNKERYSLSSPEDQNKIILDTIHRIAILSAEKHEWDKTIFQLAYKRVIESEFIYKKELKKKLSKDRKYRASIFLEKNGEFATISVNFYNANNNFLKSVELLRSFDDEWFYGRLISNNKWFDNLQFGMHSKNNEIIIQASVDRAESETIISPVNKTKEELEKFLRRITYLEFSNEDDFKKWYDL
ncbi:MAG: hypothetical protein V4553_20990 [Bacteroidota bacterium]